MKSVNLKNSMETHWQVIIIEVCEGYVFTGVCLSTGRYGRHRPADTPPGQTPPLQTPPTQCMLGYGRWSGGTHPAGMHSCCGLQLYFYWRSVFVTKIYLQPVEIINKTILLIWQSISFYCLLWPLNYCKQFAILQTEISFVRQFFFSNVFFVYTTFYQHHY